MSSATVWTRSLADEFWSGSVTPLMYSVSGGLIERRMVSKGLRLAGIRPRGAFLRYYRGYVYVSTDVLGDVLEIFPSIFLTQDILDHLPDTLRQQFEGRPRSLASIFGKPFVLACARTFFTERGWSPFTNHLRFRRHGQAVLSRAARGFGDEVSHCEPEALIHAMERVESDMGDFLEAAIWGVTYAYLLYPLVRIVSERWLGEHEGRVAEWAMAQVEGNKTVEVNRAIEDLAGRLRADPDLLARVKADPLGRDRDRVASAAELDLRGAFRALLAEHGHRLLGRDLIYPSWREDPATVMGLVLKAAEVGVGGLRRPERPPELDRRRRLWPLPRVMLELGLYYMPRYVNLRENMRYFADLYLARARQVASRLGGVLASRHQLDDPEQVFFLFRDELDEAARRPSASFAERAAERRADWLRAQTEKPPLALRGDEAADERARPASTVQGLLEGSGVSRGVVRGRARVILDVREFQEVEPGDILVTNATDPGWTSLFSLAGGVIMEMGGMLSHGAILAREYALPAVANIGGATQRIRTGTLVEVDGLNGRVRILEEAAGD